MGNELGRGPAYPARMRRRLSVLLALLALVPTTPARGDSEAADDPPAPTDRDAPWPGRELPFEPSADDRPALGTGFTGAHPLPEGRPWKYGVRVAGVRKGGALHAAGLRDGDVIVELAGRRLDDGPREGAVQRLRETLKPLPPDSRTSLVYHRRNHGETRLELLLGRRPPRFDRLPIPPEWDTDEHRDPALVKWIERMNGLDDGATRWSDINARHRKRFGRRDALWLREPYLAVVEPTSHESLSTELLRLLRLGPHALRFDRTRPDPSNPADGARPYDDPPAPDDATVDSLLAEAAQIVGAVASRTRAAVGWDEDDRAFAARAARGLTERFAVDGEYVHGDADVSRERDSRRLIAMAAAVDRDALADALDRLNRWIPARIGDWRRVLTDAEGGTPRGELGRLETPFGDVVFCGSARQTHKTRAALRVDLGGNDRYLDCAARAGGDVPVSVSVDLGGDDLYGATAPFGQAGALGGVALLFDAGGDDQYLGRQWAQAAAFCGIAVLDDRGGRDTYRALECSQGVALCGAAVLRDRAGDDTFTAQRFAQGVGLPGGIGAVLDDSGDDRFAATGRYPSEYGEDGVFSGWSQGVGYGFRHVASGGAGLLWDGAGDDVYEAGNFSQGGAYFHAWGVLRDDAGDDRYIGSRYAQGYAAHQAAGTFVEGGGDDLYQSHSGVAQGLSWDETVVTFRERGGNDRYETRGFSLASAAHNGIVFFVDDEGDDVYADRPGKARSNTYHGGHSFALFVDGGGDDRYRGAKPALSWNGRTMLRHDGAYFVDWPHGLSTDARLPDVTERPKPADAPR